MSNIVVAFHSGYGNTAKLADAVSTGIASVDGAVARPIRVADKAVAWSDFDDADAIVFGAPTYMGSLSAPFKAFMDATSSEIWMQQRWRGKWAAGFTNSAWPSGDKMLSLLQLVAFAGQHGMLWAGLDLFAGEGEDAPNRIGSWIGAMARSPHGSAGPSRGDLAAAEHLGRRVATLATARR